MKKLIASTFVLFVMCLVASEVASAQFLIGPKPEKKWMEHFYRANGQAPAPKPATISSTGNSVEFIFTRTPDVSLFTTTHPAYNGSLLGDLAGKTISASYDISGATVFTYYGQGTTGNPCPTPASVRLYFRTNNNELGYSQYWWSNPEGNVLATGPESLSANLDPTLWTNWNGQHDAAGFAAAVADVQQIGVSFGGGCFFANGVGDAGGNATFTLTNFTANP